MMWLVSLCPLFYTETVSGLQSQRKTGLPVQLTRGLHEVHHVKILFKSDIKHVQKLNKLTLTVTGESTR